MQESNYKIHKGQTATNNTTMFTGSGGDVVVKLLVQGVRVRARVSPLRFQILGIFFSKSRNSKSVMRLKRLKKTTQIIMSLADENDNTLSNQSKYDVLYPT